MLKDIVLALIPMFVAVDPIGVMPYFVSLTEGLTEKEKKHIITQSMLTAAAVAVGFILVGKGVFHVLGITIGDFMIAGGAILFTLAITDILNPVKERRNPGSELGVVPLGMPLIVGPAVLTTSLVMIPEYGIVATLISVVANILLVGAVFRSSSFLLKLLGEAGTKAISKIISLLLAAIAVMFIRKGLEPFFG
jgi:multiple antibiotic resistance protein